jgi:hypothetical protein
MSNELTDYQLVVKVRCHGETLDELQEQISQTIAEYHDGDFDIKYVEEAKRDKILEALKDETEWPTAIFTEAHYDEEEGGVPAQLLCPCGGEIYERDIAERWNTPDEIANDWYSDGPRTFTFDTGGDHQFDGDGFFCSSCMKDVNLPDNFTDWTYN